VSAASHYFKMLTPATELRVGIFGGFNAWPSGDQELIRLLFRIAVRMHEQTVEHQVAYPHPT
jgi:hypothetical protein